VHLQGFNVYAALIVCNRGICFSHYNFSDLPLPAMFMTQPRVRAVFATDEKLEELGPKQSPDSLTPFQSDPPDGGFQVVMDGSGLVRFSVKF
jgi:hypothetical protein